MNLQIEDFKTGWFGITLGIKRSEIDSLVRGLENLKREKDLHFHIRGDYAGEGGIADIEFYSESDESDDNGVIDLSPEIPPNR